MANPNPNNPPPVAVTFKRLLLDNYGLNESDVKNESSFTNDLGMDSLDLYELVIHIEKEFDIEIPDDEAEKIQTVGQAISYIETKLFNQDGWGFGDPRSPLEIEEVEIKRNNPADRPWDVFNFHNFTNPGTHQVSVGAGSNDVYNFSPGGNDNDCKDPLKPHYLTCDQWLLMNGHGFLSWLKNQTSYKVYKPESFLDSQALANGMSTASYITDRLGLIIESLKPEQVKSIGQALRIAGHIGTFFSAYKLYTAYSDGNITTRDVLAGVSFGLTVITFVPGVGTAIGLSGLALLSVGSMVFAIASDNVDDSVLIDFKTR